MNSQSHIFSSESVTEGHPDKVADQISDAVLDALLAEDPDSRVACETLVTTGMAVLSGEITSTARINYTDVVRKTIEEIGYTNAAFGFDCTTCAVLTSLDTQSPDIAMGVDTGGAGDQGMMFGYACTETQELMPIPITLAHKLTRRLSEVRRSGELPWLRPDGKGQVSIQYEDGKPVAVRAVVVSTQHDEEIKLTDLREAIRAAVIDPVLAESGLDIVGANYFINPTGRFVVGGPQGDAGLTGRKIIVDTYGGFARHGGGAFSGKDPSKVDRSATYAARWVAKNVVAAGLASHCEVQFAYAIGVAEPVSVMIETFGTGVAPDPIIEQAVRAVFELNPAGIIKSLNLRSPMYQPTAAFGHFGQAARTTQVNGKNIDLFTWEGTDAAADMQAAVEAASAHTSS